MRIKIKSIISSSAIPTHVLISVFVHNTVIAYHDTNNAYKSK